MATKHKVTVEIEVELQPAAVQVRPFMPIDVIGFNGYIAIVKQGAARAFEINQVVGKVVEALLEESWNGQV